MKQIEKLLKELLKITKENNRLNETHLREYKAMNEFIREFNKDFAICNLLRVGRINAKTQAKLHNYLTNKYLKEKSREKGFITRVVETTTEPSKK